MGLGAWVFQHGSCRFLYFEFFPLESMCCVFLKVFTEGPPGGLVNIGDTDAVQVLAFGRRAVGLRCHAPGPRDIGQGGRPVIRPLVRGWRATGV